MSQKKMRGFEGYIDYQKYGETSNDRLNTSLLENMKLQKGIKAGKDTPSAYTPSLPTEKQDINKSSQLMPRRAREKEETKEDHSPLKKESYMEEEIKEEIISIDKDSELEEIGQSNIPKTTERLMIKEIIMYNFKSYYGKRVIGPLHKNFTTIVGPNGSGKSNLIECLLFVFGKRAKKMRVSTNIGDLIHNSSEHQHETTAYVEIIFHYIVDYIDDENLYEVKPDTTFSVRREIKRSLEGQTPPVSSYLIDGKKSSYSEVQLFLKDKHQIDLDHDRFLILQGEVESISMMPSKGSNPNEVGLLEYLEDIIGSSKYTEKVEKLKETLEMKREEKNEKQKIVTLIREQIKSMKDEKNETLSFMRLETKYYKLLIIKSYASLGKVKISIEKMEESKLEYENKITQCKLEFDAKEEEMKEKGKRILEIQQKMHTNSTRQKETVEEMKILEKKDTENNADQKRYILEMEQLQKDNVTHKKERDELEKNLSVYSEKIPEMEAECEASRKQVDEIRKEFDEIHSRVQSETEGTKSQLRILENKRGKLRLKIQMEINQIERAKEAAEFINLKQEEKDLKIISQNIEKERENLDLLEEDYQRI